MNPLPPPVPRRLSPSVSSGVSLFKRLWRGRWATPDATPAKLNLALQGGGAHGAFTWGVLDALLEDGRLGFEGISGTSAGAMNALAMAHGLMVGGPDGAREALQKFWTAVAGAAPLLIERGAARSVALLLSHGGCCEYEAQNGHRQGKLHRQTSPF